VEEKARTYESAVINSASSSSPSVQYLNGRCERSTRAMVSVMILVPKRSLNQSARCVVDSPRAVPHL
jgi:hypothetical protein